MQGRLETKQIINPVIFNALLIEISFFYAKNEFLQIVLHTHTHAHT